jgi:hypothetical protein
VTTDEAELVSRLDAAGEAVARARAFEREHGLGDGEAALDVLCGLMRWKVERVGTVTT